jgi:type I restriction enzyme S subunit
MRASIKSLIVKEIRGLWGDNPTEGQPFTLVIKTNDLSYEGAIDFSNITKRNIDLKKAEENYLQPGDLLIEKSGGTKDHSVGYVDYFDGDRDTYVCNNFILAIRPNPSVVIPKYLFYILKFLYENGAFFDCYNKTTGIQNLKCESYLKKEINVPDVEEQKNVVKILDCIASEVKETKHQCALLDEIIKSRFNEMFGDPILNEKQWRTQAMKNCCSFKPAKNMSHVQQVWLLNLDHIESNTGKILDKEIVPLSSLTNSTFFFTKDYVLFSKLRPYLNKVVLPNENGYGTTELVPILPGKDVNRVFLAFLLRSDSFVRWIDGLSYGSKMPRASVSMLKEFSLIVPPLEKQNVFLAFSNGIDKLKFDIQRKNDLLNELFAYQCHQYFKVEA